jgi:type I restriction enzyme S subunit
MKVDEIPFSELLSAVVDNRGKTCPTADSGIPLIATNCIRNELLYPTYDKVRFVSKQTYGTWFRGHPKPGDIIFVNKATPGRVCLIPDPVDFCIAQDMVAIRANEKKVYSKFLFALLRSPAVQARIEQMQVGTLIPHFKKGDFDKLILPIPERKIQEFIGDNYFVLSAKIDLNRRMNETLEALAQRLFTSWFVDATQSGLLKNWHYATIAELCDINAWTLNKNDELDRIEYVEISEVVRGNIGSIQSYERGEEPSRARRRLHHGDTVLSTVRPDRGSYFLCLHPSPNLIASTGFAVLTPTKAPWTFIHAAMTQTDVFEYLGQQADGGAYPAVRPEIIGRLKVPWPDKSEVVEEFHRVCAPLYERAELNRRESRTLAALRDALLPKLLSGQLRIKNI